MRTIKLYWSAPIEINELLSSDEANDVGIYYITRLFGTKETDIYIGKSTVSFKSRLEAHYLKDKWLSEYRGQIYVRLGRIISPNWYEWEKHKKLIGEVESLLIYNMRDIISENTVNMKSVNISEDTVIINYGHSGELPKTIKHMI